MTQSVPDSEIDMGELAVRLNARIIRPRLAALACSAALVTALAGCGGSSQKPAVLGPPTSATSATSGTTATSAASASISRRRRRSSTHCWIAWQTKAPLLNRSKKGREFLPALRLD